MFSRARMIQDVIDDLAKVGVKADDELQIEEEHPEDVVFHTLGNLNQYKGLLLEEEDE